MEQKKIIIDFLKWDWERRYGSFAGFEDAIGRVADDYLSQQKLEQCNVRGSTAVKKPYYQLSDGADVCRVVMQMSGILEWIKVDEDEYSELTDDRFYTLEPIWLTDEEYRNLPEADI